MTATTSPRHNHPVVALRLDGAVLRALDQTRLPFDEHELELTSAADVAAAIKRLSIRGRR
jgi:methylthioribose-1-phosphate isomerase